MEFKKFITRLLKTKGIDVSSAGSVPYWMAYVGGYMGVIPISAVKLMGQECTINDSKARREIGYEVE